VICDLEMALLVRATQKYGLDSWTVVRREFLPDWTTRELKSKYQRKVKPLIAKMRESIKRADPETSRSIIQHSREKRGDQSLKIEDVDCVLGQDLLAPQWIGDLKVNKGPEDGALANTNGFDLDLLQPLFCEEPPQIERQYGADISLMLYPCFHPIN